MPSGIEVRGLDDLARLSRALRAAGDQGKGLKRELSKELNRETKQTRKDMRAAIVPGLPQRGGLAADVLSRTRFATQTKVSGDVGVRIKVRSKRAIRRMNATGAFRHPVFGRRDTWVTQIAGKPARGFLDKPFEASRPELQQAVIAAIARIRNRINGST